MDAVAEHLDLATIPSATRRGFHLAETARAYQLKREPVATVTKLNKAYNESPDGHHPVLSRAPSAPHVPRVIRYGAVLRDRSSGTGRPNGAVRALKRARRRG